MSYLEKLIERATDTSLNLENNKIGNYRITPQHGLNVFVYHIYKNENHGCTISITEKVIIEVNETYLTPKEITNIINVINNLYGNNKDINVRIM